jgi:hypothetical protein
MALPRSYLTSTKNLSSILNAIQTAKAPEKFTQRFLETLEFKSAADRLIIGVLKALKFLSDDGKPTERYYAFLDQTQAPHVLADGIRDAYADLFQVNTNAQNMSKADLINKFKTLSQGQLSESVLDKLALTFNELVKLADFSAAPAATPASVQLPEAPPAEVTLMHSALEHDARGGKVKVGGLVYNIQIVLPESREQAVYDALFRSLREHLG